MRTLRSGVLVWALIVSGCGGNAPVVTYPNGPAPQYQTPPAYQQPQAPALSQQPAQPSGPNAPGNFVARFLDKRTQAPIMGLEVTILDTGQKAKTGADGKVAIANIPGGAKYETFHNDFVQVKESVPAGAVNSAGLDIPLTAMADFK
jgi:hypothetical protein